MHGRVSSVRIPSKASATPEDMLVYHWEMLTGDMEIEWPGWENCVIDASVSLSIFLVLSSSKDNSPHTCLVHVVQLWNSESPNKCYNRKKSYRHIKSLCGLRHLQYLTKLFERWLIGSPLPHFSVVGRKKQHEPSLRSKRPNSHAAKNRKIDGKRLLRGLTCRHCRKCSPQRSPPPKKKKNNNNNNNKIKIDQRDPGRCQVCVSISFVTGFTSTEV